MTQAPYGYPPQGYPAQPGYAPPAQPYAPPAPPQQYPPQGYPQQGYGPAYGQAPAAPQAPAVPLAVGSIDQFYSQPSAAAGPGISWKDKPIGTWYAGIVDTDVTQAVQDTNFDTGAPLFQRDGVTPKYVMPVALRVDPAQFPEFPEGIAVFYVRGQAKDELARAMAEAGCSGGPKAGAYFQVQLTERRPQRKGNPKNIVQIVYRPKDGIAHNVAPAAQPAVQAPAQAPVEQPAPPAPPVHQPPVQQYAPPVPAQGPPVAAAGAPSPVPAPAPQAPPVQAQPAPPAPPMQQAPPAQAPAQQLPPQPPPNLPEAQQQILAALAAGQPAPAQG